MPRLLLAVAALLALALPVPLRAQVCGGMMRIGLYSDQPGPQVRPGQVIELRAQVISASGYAVACDLSWSVSGPGRLMERDYTGARVQVMEGPGMLTVRVQVRGSASSYAQARFEVLAVPILLELRPDTVELKPGQEQKVQLLMTTEQGDTYELHQAAWASDDPAVATVDSTGLVRAVGAGTTTVRAVLKADKRSRQEHGASAVVRVAKPEGED